MAKILYLTQVLPYPLDSGAKVRQYHMLRHLARRHEVTLVSFSRPDDPPSATAHLAEICQAVYPVAMRRSAWRNVCAGVRGVLTGQPIVVTRDEIGEMKATIRRLVQQTGFEVVHADQISMAGYGQFAAQVSGAHRPKTLLDAHNAVYVLSRRMAETEPGKILRIVMQREARAFTRYEAAMCRSYDALLTVTQEDQEHLLALFAPDERDGLAGKFATVPICVDPAQVPMVTQGDGHPPTILHLGTMFWPPNISGVLWFAAEVLPRIHEQIPEARFVVIGKNPPREVESLATDPRVQVTGYVDDLLPYLEQTDVFVVPLHAGSGMRVKILDAWLWGLPVVSTPIGAEGIRVQNENNILLAESAAAFAQAILRLLRDRTLNRELRENGRAWVESHYGWQSVYERVDRVYTRLLGTGQATG
ncbi:MAG: glycosyltransferase [Anaerolineales bacterium]|nr:glycosyltransferase [Anaerolineales bacterium]